MLENIIGGTVIVLGLAFWAFLIYGAIQYERRNRERDRNYRNGQELPK